MIEFSGHAPGMPGIPAFIMDTLIKIHIMAVSKELMKVVTGYGFTLTRARKHLIFDHPCGARLVTSSSASDFRSIRNVECDIRRVLKKHGIQQ